MSIGDWAATNNGHGVAVTASGTGSVTGLRIIGLRSINNGAHGVALLAPGVADTSVQNCLISSNSQLAAGTYDGINAAAGVLGLMVQGTRSGGVFSSTQRAGVRLEAGATNHVIIAGNDFRGNTTPITNGATGSEVIVKDNLPTTSAKTYVAGFSAHKNGTAQTGVTSTPVKVSFGTEVYDTGGYFDATNSRWTPPAGPVSLTVAITMLTNVVTGSYASISFYKNGSLFKLGTVFGAFTAGFMNGLAAMEDIANGTDYYEIYSNTGGALTSSIDGPATNTWFMGTTL
jgi:hypothetical protein